MSTLKRVVSLLLCVVMLISVLVSCDTDNSHNHETGESTTEQQQGSEFDHTHTGKEPSEETTGGSQPHTHTPATAVTENVVDATCTQTGSYAEVVFCSECQEEISRTQKTVDKKPHDHNQKITTSTYLKTSANCNNAAVYYYSCTCGEKGTTTFTSGDALEHTFDQKNTASTYRKSAATCTDAAVYYYSCSCGEKGTTTFTSGDTLEHTFDQKNTASTYRKSAATCTDAAVYYYSCVCGEKGTSYFANGSTIPHTFSSWSVVQIATCKVDGLEQRSCFCGEKETRKIDHSIIPHTEGNEIVVTRPTATEPGIKYVDCSICGAVIREESIPAKGYSIGLAYSINGDGISCTVTGIGTCTDADVYIPPTVGGVSVTAIGANAFRNCNKITSVTIPDGVTSIGEGAFTCCNYLTNVTIPNSVMSVGEAIFDSCQRLASITIPFVGESRTATGYRSHFGYIFGEYSSGVKTEVFPDNYIGSWVCYIPANLKTVVITDTTKIAADAFYNCSTIESLTFPNSVTSFGGDAFYGCTNLKSIIIEDGNPIYHSAGNCIIETQSKTLILGCKNSIIPTDGSVTHIGTRSFSGCSGLTSIAIPNSVKSIGYHAFENCSSLKNITIPASVETIDSSPFAGCSGLTSITVENGNPNYHSAGNCLINTKNKTLINGCATSVIPDDGSVTKIGHTAFEDCTTLTLIIIPEGVTSIDTSAFAGCTNLKSITIPDSVTTFGIFAFYDCVKLRSIYYNGTKSQFMNIRVASFWRDNTPTITVYCTDGNISLS